ncbi:MAG: DUF2232 domain-containing protein [Proteobacteria bacterium]|nr:DUF2232 domain-containing protein [Pseudomonadota bacterium]
MQRLVEWLTASRARVFLGAVVLAFLAVTPLFVWWLPGALLVLLALRHSQPASEWTAGAVAAATAAWLLLSVGAGTVPALLVAVGLVVPPLLAGRLLARGGSLSLAFQFATVAAVAMLVVVHVVLADPPGVWRPFVEQLAGDLDRMATMMSNAGSGWRPRDVDFRDAASAVVNWGVVAWLLLFNTIVAAAVGLYAYGRQGGEVLLGPAFRELRAGRTLAGAALVTVLLSLTLKWDFAVDTSRLFAGAFLLQGLALLHSARATLGFSPGWIAAAYVLLFVPVAAVFVESALAVFGFLDNWVPLRPRLDALAARGRGGAG